jgi:23S rRNA pseudoU1915 N3-methylase RlmH
VLENDNFKLYWNRSIITDKTIPSNRPDITLTNKKTKNTFLIDIAIPNTHNLAKTITEKQNKYQEMANEIRDMWKQGAVQVVAIVNSATGIIPKSLSQSLKRLNLHPNTYIQMQKVIFGTCSIVRNFLNYT